MIGLSNGRRAGLARQSVEWWTSPTDRRARVRGPVENDASMEIRKQRGFPQAARLRRISHRPDGGNASPPTCFQEAAIHLKIGNFLSEEWGHPQGLRLYSTLATAKIGPCNKPRPGRRLTTKPLCPGSCSHWKTLGPLSRSASRRSPRAVRRCLPPWSSFRLSSSLRFPGDSRCSAGS